MKIRSRIFFGCIMIFIGCFYMPINWVLDDLRTRYMEAAEDPLVDQANILAEIVGNQMERGTFAVEAMYTVFDATYDRKVNAQIYSLLKNEIDIRIYITDQKGIIIFDSESRENIGADYSRWRDVQLTLDGKYGARATQSNEAIPDSTIMYVAAPIMQDGKISGVLTVAKPTTNINNFLGRAKPKIFQVGAVSGLVAILLLYVISVWITRPIKRLTLYADDIRQGKRSTLPKLDKSEIGDMGHAFEKMREALEGKKYVEQYIQNLTHEIKSPLSAIRGAAELLGEDMSPEQQRRFLANIHTEANRIQIIIDRLLELSALESRKSLEREEQFSFLTLVGTVLESKNSLLLQKKLSFKVNMDSAMFMRGDSFLIHHAVANLLQNAIDFSPKYGMIELQAKQVDNLIHFLIQDEGPGMPDYAEQKIFEKFFSLQRPDSGKKSTGLGLNFVREIATLHGGDIRLTNTPEKGVCALLILPV